MLLGQNIAKLNSSKEQETLTVEAAAPIKRHPSLEENITSLMERGMDLEEINSSGILELYEEKISCLQDREQQLQDLLDAKTSALQRAEKILAYNKCKQALREAEDLKLRNILIESEKRSNVFKRGINQEITRRQQCKQDLIKTSEEKSALLLQIEELKEAAVQHDHKNYTDLQEKIKNLWTECTMLSDTLLQKHNETMKHEQETLSEEDSNSTMETKQLSKQVRDRDVKINELTLALRITSEERKIMQESYQTLLCKKDKHLNEQNSILIHEKAKLEQEAASLRVLCRQHESSLQEKELKIVSLHDDLLKVEDLNNKIQKLVAEVKTLNK